MADLKETQAVERVIQKLYNALEELPAIETTERLTEPIRVLVSAIREHYDIEMVTCCICKREVSTITAHLHQDEWVGEECWDPLWDESDRYHDAIGPSGR